MSIKIKKKKNRNLKASVICIGMDQKIEAIATTN